MLGSRKMSNLVIIKIATVNIPSIDLKMLGFFYLCLRILIQTGIKRIGKYIEDKDYKQTY